MTGYITMTGQYLRRRGYALKLGSLCRRLSGWVLLGLCLQGAALAQDSPRPGGPPQIGVLLFHKGFQATIQGLRDGLRKQGYTVGENIHLDLRNINRDVSQVPALVQGFLDRGYDLIVTTTTPITRKVQQLTAHKSVPVIFTTVASPLHSEVVASLRNPGGNISGISHIAFEMLAKRLQLFKSAFPGLQRVALFYNYQEPFLKGHVEEFLLPVAIELGVELVQLDVTEPGQLEQYANAPVWQGIDGILMLPDPLQVAMFDQLVALSRSRRLPLMVLDNALLARGGVMGYSPEFYDVGLQAAEMAVAVLRGADIGRMPVQNPSRISLRVSLREARRLDLLPSQDILIQADEIIR